MIDMRNLVRFRDGIDKVLNLMETHGVKGKLKSVDPTPSGLILHMDNGEHWKIRLKVEKIDGIPLRKDYAT